MKIFLPYLRHLLLVAGSWMLVSSAAADPSTVVEARLPSGKIVSADFHDGKTDKPAVLLLHGFLQTRSFPTVANAGEALDQAGYTTLLPTLSLGISRRNQSLSCEAIHTHTLQEDVAEVEFWVRWLSDRGHKRIVLVGHSFGSVQILDYLNHAPSPLIKKAILISLTDVEVKQNAEQRAAFSRNLRNRVARGDQGITEVEFSQCKRFVGPPRSLLSYLAITRETILADLRKPKVPIEVLLGSADDRMGPDWAKKLAARGITVRVIEGANHFFDNQHEFDLQDALQEGLKMPSRQAGS